MCIRDRGTSAAYDSDVAYDLVVDGTASVSYTHLDVYKRQLDGLPPVKMHCSVLAEQAVKKALYDYYQSEGLMTPEREKLFKILEEDEH